MGLVRMIRTWNEWLIVWGYDINEPTPMVTREICEQLARQLIGDDDLPIDITYQGPPLSLQATSMGTQVTRTPLLGDVVHQEIPWRSAVRSRFV